MAEAEAAGADTTDHTTLAHLKTLLPALQKEAGRISAERRRAERAIAGLREGLDECFERLLPWQGDVDALARLKVPVPAALQAWEETGAALRDTRSFQKDQVERLTLKHDRLTARRDALEQAAGLFDEAAALRTRAARDAAWQAHAARLDAETAQAFHAALEQDDALTAGRLAQSADRAEHKRMSVDLADVAAELKGAQQALDNARAGTDALKAEIAGTLRTCDPALADFSLSDLRAWMSEHAAALDLRSELRQNERDRQAAADEETEARDRLARSLEQAGGSVAADMSFDALIEQGQTLIDAEARMTTARKRLEDCRSETLRRTDALEAAGEAGDRWRDDWAEACARCWFSAPDVPSPEIAAAFIDELNALSPALEARDGLAQRIAGLEQTATTFRQATTSLASDLYPSDLHLSDLDPGAPDLPAPDLADADPRALYRDPRRPCGRRTQGPRPSRHLARGPDGCPRRGRKDRRGNRRARTAQGGNDRPFRGRDLRRGAAGLRRAARAREPAGTGRRP